MNVASSPFHCGAAYLRILDGVEMHQAAARPVDASLLRNADGTSYRSVLPAALGSPSARVAHRHYRLDAPTWRSARRARTRHIERRARPSGRTGARRARGRGAGSWPRAGLLRALEIRSHLPLATWSSKDCSSRDARARSNAPTLVIWSSKDCSSRDARPPQERPIDPMRVITGTLARDFTGAKRRPRDEECGSSPRYPRVRSLRTSRVRRRFRLRNFRHDRASRGLLRARRAARWSDRENESAGRPSLLEWSCLRQAPAPPCSSYCARSASGIGSDLRFDHCSSSWGSPSASLSTSRPEQPRTACPPRSASWSRGRRDAPI